MVVASGRLAGLLTGSGQDDVAVNVNWFANAESELISVPDRLGQLAVILAELLGEPETLSGYPGLAWYPIPGDDDQNNVVLSAARIVATPQAVPAPTQGEYGFGLHWSEHYASATVDAAAYLPLISYNSAGAQLAASSTLLHLDFQVAPAGTATFPAIAIDLQISGSGTPSGTLTVGTATYENLAAVLDSTDAVAGLEGAIEQGLGTWLQTKPGGAPSAIGQILVSAGLLTEENSAYSVAVAIMKNKTPAQVALDFVHLTLDALANLSAPLIPLPPDPSGGVSVQRTSTQQYGVHVAAEIALAGSGTPAGNGAPTQVVLSLGSWMTGETDESNWFAASGGTGPAGATVWLVESDGKGGFQFVPGLELTSVGWNLQGGGGAPLVDVDGWTMGGIELRGSVRSTDWGWGAGARLEDGGFPLGPEFDQAQTGANPVVATLLASGNGSDGSAASPVNPAFSAQLGYISGGKVAGELLDPGGGASAEVWIPIQRRFGPVSCNKVGLVLDTGSGTLGVGVDGGVVLGPLAVELDELSVTAKLDALDIASSYTLDLQGIEVSYASAGVELNGGLVKVLPETGPVSYDGEALLKAEQFALGAVGAYGTSADQATSLFVFVWLDAPLGGPPCFYVTGLAGGFGYNRALRIPAQDQVQSFPLVAGVSNPALLGVTPGPPSVPPAPQTALATLQDWVPAQRGEYWLALGVQFTSFEIVNANVLLVVEFGGDLVIAILGVATLQQPIQGPPWVSAALDLEVVFRPQEGSVLAAAVLAPGSYLLTDAAHLTGGFAFAAWFGENENAGDFVLTLGGYHPAFVIPDHYPRESRVGIDWQVNNEIAVVGEAYFAITPAAMMAGADIQATFAAGSVKAWLKADADLIVFWHPFYFDAQVQISVGVSVQLHVLSVNTTLTVEIGVNFELFGPPIGFNAHIDYYVVSFSIAYGSKTAAPPIGWEDFTQLLPTKNQTPTNGSLTDIAPGLVELEAVPGDPCGALEDVGATPAYVTVAAVDGLIRSSVVEGIVHWLMRPRDFALSVESALPPTAVTIAAPAGKTPATVPVSASISVRPVGISSADYGASLVINVYELQGTPPTEDGIADIDWTVEGDVRGVPQALWGVPVATASPALVSGDQTITTVVGATLTPTQLPPSQCTPEMVIATVFQDRQVASGSISIAPSDAPVGTPPTAADSFADIAQIATDPALSARTDLFAALASIGVTAWTNGPLTLIAASPGDAFADEPLEPVT